MDSDVAGMLRTIVERYGAEVISSAARFEAIINDLRRGELRREANLLALCVRERVPERLMAVSQGAPRSVVLTQCATALMHDHGVSETAAAWAVTTWALALGYEVGLEPGAISGTRAATRSAEAPKRTHEPRPVAIRDVTATRTNPKDGAEMVWVPEGEFIMGSNDGLSDERPQRRVYLDGYWMFRHPVTVAQYRRFCRETNRKLPDPPPRGWKDDHPVVNVSWHDAKAYADWAEAALPTEAQWEKALRGTDGRQWPWGNTFDASKAICSVGRSRSSTAPVGSIPAGASPFGCLDMAGNVWEWCADWYDNGYYANAPNRNPAGPQTGSARCLRGGSWFNGNADHFRCAYRYNDSPGDRSVNYGFRCARTD